MFQYFGGAGGAWHCWDVLVPSFNNPPDASALPFGGLRLTWAHRGDAHLACAQVVVNTNVLCDPAASADPARAQLSGVQARCTWNLVVRTASTAVCGAGGAEAAVGAGPAARPHALPESPTLVRTKSNGFLQGGLSRSGKTRFFLGIQYATAERWKPPRAVVSAPQDPATRGLVRGDPQNATMFGPSCWQQGGVAAYPQSEHCLNLNVFAPVVPPPRKDSGVPRGHPVLFWIHGGCYDYGTANQRIGNGTNLVERFGDVVVVSINYRLSAFGFLGSDALRGNDLTESTGNYGLLDQREAMRWVQNNIAAFGGDPTRVMIFGQSAGAGSVANHLVSRGSWGLFRRAAMESGSFANWIAMPLQGSEKNWDALVKAAGCAPSTNRSAAAAAAAVVVACMRALPAAELAKYSGQLHVPCRDGCTFAPVVDGVTLSDYPWKLMEKERAPGVPIMHGSNLDDGLLFVNMSRTGSKKDLAHWLKKMYSGDPHMPNRYIRKHVDKLYPKHEYPKTSPLLSRPFWVADRVETDFAYACPADRTSAAFSTKGVGRRMGSDSAAAVFQYRFAAGASTNATVLHGDELPFVWLEAGHAPAEVRLAETMSGFWVNFCRSGDPNKGGAVPSGTTAWPAWTKERREVLQFQSGKDDIAVVLKGGVDRKRCEKLWTKNWHHFGRCLPCTIDDAQCN